MKNNFVLVGIFSLLFIIGCKDKIIPQTVETGLKINDIQFHSFSTKAKIHYKDNKQNLNVTGNIRMQKDSIIWISVTYLGFEAGRMKIMPDSVHIMNRLQSEYYVYAFSEFSQKLNFDVDFASVQAIFLGNQPLKGQGNQKLQKGTEFHLLTKEIARFLIDYKVNAQTLKIEELVVNEKNTNNKTIVNYTDFQVFEEKLIPTTTTIQVLYNDTTELEPFESLISFNYSKCSFSDSTLNYPFHVSSKFTKK